MLASFLMILAIFMAVAFVSHVHSNSGHADQSEVMSASPGAFTNYLGKVGAFVSYYVVYRGIGVSAYFLPFFIFILSLGIYGSVFLGRKLKLLPLLTLFGHLLFLSLWTSVFCGAFFIEIHYSGWMGMWVQSQAKDVIGTAGLVTILFFVMAVYLMFTFRLFDFLSDTLQHLGHSFKRIMIRWQDYMEVSKQKRKERKQIRAELREQKRLQRLLEKEQKEAEKLEKETAQSHSEEINTEAILSEETKQPSIDATDDKELTGSNDYSTTIEFDDVEIGRTVSDNTKPTERNEEAEIDFVIEQPAVEGEPTAVPHKVPEPDVELVDGSSEQSTEQMQQVLSENQIHHHLLHLPEEITPSDVERLYEEYDDPLILAEELVKRLGEFDPTLELPKYEKPTTDLLEERVEELHVDQNDVVEDKERIVETLNNYKISIDKIKATIGPTVTLYEIIPKAGTRISQIKKLEDDIALSLAALGIRIIAPIPGKGTIGIEVPNKKPSVVSMNTVIQSEKFQSCDMDLPCALGKTISGEIKIIDLAKMPHLLIAGATGQGKSVGLNAILTSLLYKKHPAEIKFVLVDPKKVELSLFNHIRSHFLARLPDVDEPIITDTSKVVATLNSLCLEMDNRYNLLKDAQVRNIKEYNHKITKRRLNPNKGHKFLPYIVLVVDEFADLIMTAGKEVELPIARLAQLARAIGIHLIIATQRPSVNVITGIIKANFPARIAFRVTSKIDSRTILDGPGADQLIGRGDMLLSQGSDLVRVQCAFVDTPEVERITEMIGKQVAFPSDYLLPEYTAEGDEGEPTESLPQEKRDKYFEEAARVVVLNQQGSTSYLQRKFSIGYNRAGKIVDQLEVAGIVGPNEGSKGRKVLITSEAELDMILGD